MAPIAESIFRAYDIRGIAGDSLTYSAVYQIALALGCEALARQKSQFVVGRDGRLSSPELFEALCKGLQDSGCTLWDIGMVPTPMLYFALHHYGISSGVMLTGSHNAPQYNGLKILMGGQRLTAEQIQSLYQRVRHKNNTHPVKHGSRTVCDVSSAYRSAISHQVSVQRPLTVVVDAGNGVAGHIAPSLYQALGCHVVALFCAIDGRFPHHHPDPTVPDNLAHLRQAVLSHQADIGLAFDGDGDRLGVVTNQGNIIWPDRQMMLYAEQVLKQHPGSCIVFDVKCSDQLGKWIKQLGGQPELWKTGHALIKSRMDACAAPLAGEMSGHIFFADRWFGFDDGLYVGARLLEILAQQPFSAEDLFQKYPDAVNTPELKIAIHETEKFTAIDKLIQTADFQDASINLIDGVRVTFEKGWGLIRASNTSPYLTLRFEASDLPALIAIQSRFRTWIKKVLPTSQLPF